MPSSTLTSQSKSTCLASSVARMLIPSRASYLRIPLSNGSLTRVELVLARHACLSVGRQLRGARLKLLLLGRKGGLGCGQLRLKLLLLGRQRRLGCCQLRLTLQRWQDGIKEEENWQGTSTAAAQTWLVVLNVQIEMSSGGGW